MDVFFQHPFELCCFQNICSGNPNVYNIFFRIHRETGLQPEKFAPFRSLMGSDNQGSRKHSWRVLKKSGFSRKLRHGGGFFPEHLITYNDPPKIGNKNSNCLETSLRTDHGSHRNENDSKVNLSWTNWSFDNLVNLWTKREMSVETPFCWWWDMEKQWKTYLPRHSNLTYIYHTN